MADEGVVRKRNGRNESSKSEIDEKNPSLSNESNAVDDRRRCSRSSPGQQKPSAAAVTTREYAQAFRQWMWQYQLWAQAQASLMFTFPLNYYAPMAATPCSSPSPAFGGVLVPPPPAANGPTFGAVVGGRPFGPMPVAQPPQNAADQQPALPQGRECQLASLWKRVVAEFIDFFLLFVMKLAASIMVIEYFGILDIEKYDIDQLLAQDWDSDAALSFTSDLIAMEIINRIFICLFETLCLRRGFGGSIGGTTPGKHVMRLRVISCQSVAQLPGNRVLITPGNDIGFWNAFLRSVIKNFSLVFFFPVCFTVFFFPNSRTAYDIASSSIVVEITTENAWAWPRR